MKEIKLSQGKVTIVEDQHFEDLNQWKWCYHKGAAVRNERKIINGKNKVVYILLHRFLLKPNKGMVVDHIDGDPLNNIRNNIRVCTQSQNLMNKRVKRNKTSSKYKGVFFNKKRKTWNAQLLKRGECKYLGAFDTEIEAAKSYDSAALEKYGEYARLNLAGGVSSELK